MYSKCSNTPVIFVSENCFYVCFHCFIDVLVHDSTCFYVLTKKRNALCLVRVFYVYYDILYIYTHVVYIHIVYIIRQKEQNTVHHAFLNSICEAMDYRIQ